MNNTKIDKKKVIYILVNHQKNKDKLNKAAYIKFHDLAIVFFNMIENRENYLLYEAISMDLMVENELSLEELFALSQENMPKLLPAKLDSMENIVMTHVLEDTPHQSAKDLDIIMALLTGQGDRDLPQMYTLTNDVVKYGAATLLYPDMLKKISECFDNDFYILPSSLHETILIPFSNSIHKEELKTMVREVNQEELADEDILSDNVYLYNKSKGNIEII